MVIDTFLEQVAATSKIEWFGTVTGILGVWFSAKEKIAAWPCFILCYVAYTILSYQFGLMTTMGMNIVFGLISIYGWLQWTQTTEQETSAAHIRRTPVKERFTLLLAGGSATICMTLLLPSGGIQILEAIGTSTALIAQWMLSRKQIESWLLWIVSDIIFMIVWGSQSAYLTVGLFAIFTILAVQGWRDWHRQIVKVIP